MPVDPHIKEEDEDVFTEEPPYVVVEEHVLRMAYFYRVFSPIHMDLDLGVEA